MRAMIKASGSASYGILVVALSGTMNVLALAGAIYMLQVYDRVLTSHSLPTLVALSILIFGAYVSFGVLDVLRSQILLRMGLRIDGFTMPLAHRALLLARQRGSSLEQGMQGIKDVDLVRSFLGTGAALAVVDLAWVPLYLAFLWLVSPELAWLTSGGIMLLIVIAAVCSVGWRRREAITTQLAQERMGLVDAQLRNAQPLFAMRLAGVASRRFQTAHASLVAEQARAADLSGGLAASLRVLRLMLQSAIVGLGAYLVIQDRMTAGAIIAASVAAGRALSPIDTAIASWASLRALMQSIGRLEKLVAVTSRGRSKNAGAAKPKSLAMRDVAVAHPAGGPPVLSGIGLEINAGQALLVVGKSGAGKSTLLEAAAGLARLQRGAVLIDGLRHLAVIDDNAASLIGYLPQQPSFHPGSIAENIAMMRDAPSIERIQRSARLVGLHELLESLPDGYETRIEEIGDALTPGMKQRLAIARAFYGDPALLVLDDPCAHLDADGEGFLVRAIRSAQSRGAIIIATATRTNLLPAVTHIAVLEQGRLTSFGPKTNVLTELRNRRDQAALAQPLAVGGENQSS